MAIPLALLGFFRDGTTEYGAARARTDGSWHIVRKQYGDNSSVYSYARFTSAADYAAAQANPNAVVWQPEPFSSIDYQLLLTGLVSPLPASTTSMGALAAASATTTDVSPVVKVVSDGNAILASMLAGQQQPGSRASETTLAKVLAALVGTLKMGVDGTVTVANFPASFAVSNFPAGFTVAGSVAVTNLPAVQAVSGPATDAQLRATPLPMTLATVPLAANAATAALQMAGNSSLAEVSGKLNVLATSQGQADQLAKLEALRVLLAGAATAGGQADQVAKLTAIAALLGQPLAVTGALTDTQLRAAALPLPVGASTAGLQTAGNTALGNILTALGPSATASLQTAGNTLLQSLLASAGSQLSDLDAIKASAALASTAALQSTGNDTLANIRAQLGAPVLPVNSATAAKQDTGNTTLNSILTALGPAATAAKQDATNTALGNLLTALNLTATASKQDALAGLQTTANGYLQSLAQQGIATTASAATPYSLVTANGNNATTIRVGATWLLGGTVTNTANAVRYFFLYNLASVPATLPTTAAGGLVRTVAIMAGQTLPLNLAANRYTAFPAGLTIAAATASTLSTVTTTVAGVTGSVGLTAGDLVINLDYAG